METVKEYTSVKITRAGKEDAIDPVMVEQTIDLIINGTKLSSIVTTPDLHKELAVGYMVTEGAVKDRRDIEEVMEKDGKVFLKVRSFEHFDLWYELRSSGCIGVNWEKRDEDVSVPVSQTFPARVILDSLKYLFSEIQDRTRGAHSACLIDAEGRLRYQALDIGRHNAIDKVVGMALLNGDDLSKMFLLSSGRQPAGMVMKAVRAGIPLIVSKAAPISSGIESARRANVTLACFADREKVKVFSVAERIVV
ncbi:formate dehydrogenase accessory sulfurtransferase FdhD [Methanocella sp. MCL-LM]|uniref:formate dehydrogenase accessory sulfurtransferase FdhD n=1 Tax=Methanocella sp. MCL-LM TaxID=3412035 RepID=UPI003C722F84